MAKKHKHEEHVNHERWLVSFADMMTLLFALFVVLYALASMETTKQVEELKKSIQFAFHIEGEGKTKEDGAFLNQSGAGDVQEPAPLLNAQDGPMVEFLANTLKEFERVAGRSMEIDQTEESVTMRAPMSAFFPHERSRPLDPDVYNWLTKMARGAMTFTGNVKVVIDTPNVILASRNGRRRTSIDLCNERLLTMRSVLVGLPEIKGSMVAVMLNEQPDTAGDGQDTRGWQDQATIVIAFSNGS